MPAASARGQMATSIGFDDGGGGSAPPSGDEPLPPVPGGGLPATLAPEWLQPIAKTTRSANVLRIAPALSKSRAAPSCVRAPRSRRIVGARHQPAGSSVLTRRPPPSTLPSD